MDRRAPHDASNRLDFVAQRIIPNLERIESQEEGLTPNCSRRWENSDCSAAPCRKSSGGWFGLQKHHAHHRKHGRRAQLRRELLCPHWDCHVAHPLLRQRRPKAEVRPGLATGELKGCYCLTEPGSGSDANSGKTTAKLNEAGTHYVLNGQKMWITNGGFADILIVFAKIDGDENLSAFIRARVQRHHDEPRGKEEGIKGRAPARFTTTWKCSSKTSSTSAARLQNCRKHPQHRAHQARRRGHRLLQRRHQESVKYTNAEQFGGPSASTGRFATNLARWPFRPMRWKRVPRHPNIDDAIADLAAGGMDKGEGCSRASPPLPGNAP